jgi:phage tail-like protein
MRGVMPGLVTPYPLGELLPAILQEDEFTMRWTRALDEVLAPAVAALDCITAYIDPLLAPDDFLNWISSWFGAVLDENWPEERRRAVVAASAALYRTRGTLAGLQAHLDLVADGHVEVSDNGGVAWSATPDAELPGDPAPAVTVRIRTSGRAQVNVQALDALIAAIKPAHVVHNLEVASK